MIFTTAACHIKPFLNHFQSISISSYNVKQKSLTKKILEEMMKPEWIRYGIPFHTIDFSKSHKSRTDRHQRITCGFSLFQHPCQPTKKGFWLVDPIKLFNECTAWSPIKGGISSPLWGSLEERSYLKTADITSICEAVLYLWNKIIPSNAKHSKTKKKKQWTSSHNLHPVHHTQVEDIWKYITAKVDSLSSALPKQHLVNY